MDRQAGSADEQAPVEARVHHAFSATPEQVFDGWLDPELIGRWMFRTVVPDEEVVRIELKPEVGGTFSFVVRRDGQELDHFGTYEELDRPRRLAFTWFMDTDEVHSRVIVDIADGATGATATLTHELDPAWADYVEQTRDSWATMLAALDRLLAGR